MYSCRTNVIKLMSIDGYRCVGVMFGNPLPRWGVFHQWLVTEWCGCPALPRSLRRVGLGKCRLSLLRGLHLVNVLCFSRIVIPPQPDHLLRKLSRSMPGIMRAFPETEMK